MLIAIPAFRVSCNVGIDKGRSWSVIEEILLWAAVTKTRSLAELVEASLLPRQVIVAALARLMRFRLVEIVMDGNEARFGASAYGRELVESGRALPFFPKREKRRVSFIVEQATGSFFLSAPLRIVSGHALANDPDPDIRYVEVEGGGPLMTHEANLARLSEIAARGWDEQLALVDGRTSSVRSEYMVIRVVDGVPRNMPDGNDVLRKVIDAAIASPGEVKRIPVSYAGARPQPEEDPSVHACDFEASDLIIGGPAHLDALKDLIKRAHRRVIIHSTFLDPARFKLLIEDFRTACIRGVTFDLLWGAEGDDETEDRNSSAAVAIARIVREDRDLQNQFRTHMRTTGSHAKLLLADGKEGDWIAAIGSCNWLSSPFKSVELTAIFRQPRVVADVAVALQRMVGRRGLSDDIANEMALLALELRKHPPSDGKSQVVLVIGDRHDVIMREASGKVRKRLIVGTHRLGSTARPGMVIPAEVAASGNNDVDATLIYTRPSGPLKNRHARKLEEEAAKNNVRLIKASTPLHGKFVAWDDDDVVVTSLNWGSASSDFDFPQADLGVHVKSAGIAKHAMLALAEIFPAIVRPDGSSEP